MYRNMAGWATFGVGVRALQLGILQKPLRTGELPNPALILPVSGRREGVYSLEAS